MANGQLDFPEGVAVDGVGNVYVVDSDNDRVQKFSSTGTFLTNWGTLGTGNGQFDSPNGVAVDAVGNVYISDPLNHRVQKFSSSGAFLTKWGALGSGNGQFNSPRGVAVDGVGNVYVVDTLNHRVQKFSSSGAFLTKWGASGSGNGQFSAPNGVAVDGVGNVYVVDTSNFRVQKFSSAGAFLTKWGTGGSGDSKFRSPRGVTIDAFGNVYVADTDNHQVQKFSSTGAFLTRWGTSGSGNGQFRYPRDVASDAVGNVYVTDALNNRVQVFSPTGSYLTQWGAFVVDTTMPSVTITTPAAQAVYAMGQAVKANYGCIDDTGGSGIATCVGTVPNGSPIDTSGAGTKSFTVTATDNAGNQTVTTRNYTVALARPDGRIKRGATGTLVGNNVYNTSTGQTVVGSAARGKTVTYVVSVQNDGRFADRFRLKGVVSNRSFTIRYANPAGTDVTAAVTAGTLTTAALRPGGTFNVTVKVTVAAAAPSGAKLVGALTATSATHTTRTDTVVFTTSRR
jgi:DNA-binding beta-propeller fold protein YncE